MKFSLAAPLAAIAIFGSAGAASATFLIQNGSFEANTAVDPISGWNTFLSNGSGGDTHSIQVGGAEDGNNYYSATNATGPDFSNQIFQNFTDTSGQVYDLSFWLKFSGPTVTNGQSLTAFSGAGQIGNTNFFSDQGWTQYTGTFVGTGNDNLDLSYAASSSGDTIGLDNVSVTPDLTPTPEPATPVSLAVGLAFVVGLIIVRQRKMAIAR